MLELHLYIKHLGKWVADLQLFVYLRICRQIISDDELEIMCVRVCECVCVLV